MSLYSHRYSEKRKTMDNVTKGLIHAGFLVRQISERIYAGNIDHRELTKLRKEVNKTLFEAIRTARRGSNKQIRDRSVD
jgi:hypothetical protein